MDGSVSGFLHAGILVRDLAKARDFYGRLLGLAEIDRPDLGFPGAWYGVGRFQVHLIVPPDDRPVGESVDHQGRRIRHLAFAIDGLAALVTRLEGEGFPIWSGTPAPGARRRGFTRDPDGNVVELVEAPPR